MFTQETLIVVPSWFDQHPFDILLKTSSNLWWIYPLLGSKSLVFLTSAVTTPLSTRIHGLQVIATPADESGVDLIKLLNNLNDTSLIDLSSGMTIILWEVLQVGVSKWSISYDCSLYHILRIGCVGDLHHLANPVSATRQMLRPNNYDILLLTHSQYYRFYESSYYSYGLNIFQFPVATNLLYSDLSRLPNKKDYLGMPSYHGNVNSCGIHPMRDIIVTELVQSGQIVASNKRTNFDEWLGLVATSPIVFTCSLNGSYSLQTLAALANGSLLITDQLSAASLVGKKLQSESNCFVYTSVEDSKRLLRLIASFDSQLIHQISLNGVRLFRYLNAVSQRSAELIRGFLVKPLNSLQPKTGFVLADDIVQLFELIQEIHRTSHYVEIICICDDPLFGLIRYFGSILPRLIVSRTLATNSASSADVGQVSSHGPYFLRCKSYPFRPSAAVLPQDSSYVLGFAPSLGHSSSDFAYLVSQYSTLPVWPQESGFFQISDLTKSV